MLIYNKSYTIKHSIQFKTLSWVYQLTRHAKIFKTNKLIEIVRIVHCVFIMASNRFLCCFLNRRATWKSLHFLSILCKSYNATVFYFGISFACIIPIISMFNRSSILLHNDFNNLFQTSVTHKCTVARTVMCRQDGRGRFPVSLDDHSKCRTNSQRKSQLS